MGSGGGESDVVCNQGGIPGERVRVLEGAPSVEPLHHTTQYVAHLCYCVILKCTVYNRCDDDQI